MSDYECVVEKFSRRRIAKRLRAKDLDTFTLNFTTQVLNRLCLYRQAHLILVEASTSSHPSPLHHHELYSLHVSTRIPGRSTSGLIEDASGALHSVFESSNTPRYSLSQTGLQVTARPLIHCLPRELAPDINVFRTSSAMSLERSNFCCGVTLVTILADIHV